MRYKIVYGDILKSESSILVNSVNCKGVMGAGLAKEFKLKFPQMYLNYRDMCMKGRINIGIIYVYKVKDTNQIIANLPTKIHWKNGSKLEWIKRGLESLIVLIRDSKLNSISIPMLGCGLGGINEEDFMDLFEETFVKQLEDFNIDIYLYKRRNLNG